MRSPLWISTVTTPSALSTPSLLVLTSIHITHERHRVWEREERRSLCCWEMQKDVLGTIFTFLGSEDVFV